MARKPMVIRTIRVPVDLWEQALAEAEASDESVSDVVRAALRRYVAKGKRTKV